MEYHFGVLAGLAAGLMVGALLLAVLFRKRILDCTFDERQERARGVAFKYGFFTLMISVFAYGSSELVVGRWCDALAGGVLCISVSMLVFAFICIKKDAYLSLREKPRNVLITFAVVSAANLCLGVMQIVDGDLVEDGILTFRATNLIVGVMTLIAMILYTLHYILRRREDAE